MNLLDNFLLYVLYTEDRMWVDIYQPTTEVSVIILRQSVPMTFYRQNWQYTNEK